MTQSNEQWLAEVRTGALKALAMYRRVLQQRELVDEETGEMDCVVLTRDDADGLTDLLDYMEDHLLTMWKLIVVSEEEQLTRRACGAVYLPHDV